METFEQCGRTPLLRPESADRTIELTAGTMCAAAGRAWRPTDRSLGRWVPCSTRARNRAPVAQWIERRPPEPKVAGSNPVGRAKATLSGIATASPCAYADGVSLIDTIVLPVTTIRS